MNAYAPSLLLAALLSAPAVAAPPTPAQWIPAWTASPQPRWDGDFALPTNVPYHLWNQTVRQTARAQLGGGLRRRCSACCCPTNTARSRW